MLIQCPGCRTTYKVPDQAITSPNPTFRCSRCKHVFAVALKKNEEKSPLEKPASSPDINEQEEENREFSFSFPPQKNDPEEKLERSLEVKEIPFDEGGQQKLSSTKARSGEALSNPDNAPPLGATREQTPPLPHKDIRLHTTGETGHSSSAGPLAPQDHESFIISDEDRSQYAGTSSEKQPESKAFPPLHEDRVASVPFEASGQQLPTLPYLTLFGCLVLTFSLLTFAHQVQPNRIDYFIKQIPWFGPTVFRNNYLRYGIALQSLRPSIQRLQGNRDVFVVAGVAANHNPTGVRQLRIEGRAYNAEGKEIERETMAVGNAISEGIIRDMTAQELSILQKLSPQKSFEIPSGESANFALVFLKPTKEIKSFSCRVVSAEEAS